MRLRHKKPINSYVGQANLESSEVLDEDFDKHISGGKRVKFLKQKINNDSIKRYAEILVDFIHTINTDYNGHIKKFPSKTKADYQPRTKDLPLEQKNIKKAREEQTPVKKTQVVSKQQQKAKLHQKNKLQLEQEIKKIKSNKKYQSKKKQQKLFPQIPKPEIKPTPQQSLPKKKHQIDLTLQQNEAPQRAINQAVGYHNMNPMMLQNSAYMPNGVNPALFQSLQYQMPMYQQMLSEQLKQNPNLMMYMQPYQFQNLISMFNMQNMSSNPQNYIPFSKLPFYQQKKQAKKSPQPPKKQKIQIKQKTVPKSQAVKPINGYLFNKHSCAHVAIAYHIHCQKLKSIGKFPNGMGSDYKNMYQLDPTYPARKVRQGNRQGIIQNPPDSENR